MANLLSTTVNGSLNVQGSSMYVTASQLHIGKASSGTAQMSFESWGSYTGAIAMNSSGAFHWGGQGNSEWYFKKNNTYNGDYSASGTTVLRIASDGNIYSAYYGDWLSNVFAGKVSTSGGSTIAGTTYFSGGESMQVYGIRGRFANEYIHLYNKVGIGNPNGWGEGQGSTPGYGLSTYGGAVFAYGNNATSAFYGHLRIDRNWGLGDYGAEQFTIRGTYPSIALRSTQHNSKWLIHNDDTLSFYYGGTVDDNSWGRKLFIPTDGNIWMSWAGDYISNLLNAKQNASTAITTSNIGSQSVNYAASAGNADTVDSLHASSFVRKDTTNQYLKPYYEYSSYLTSQRPIDLVNEMGGGGLRVDFLNPSYTANGNWGHVITWSGYNGYTMYQLSGSYGAGTGAELFMRNEADHNRDSWSSWRRLLNNVTDSYAANMNQYVRTTDSPTFAEGTFGSSGGSDKGIQIHYVNNSGGYGRIRFYQNGSNHSTIHSFSNSWQSGSLAGHSTGAINLEGNTGVTFGAWNNVDMWIDTSGNAQARTSLRAPIFYDSNDTAYYVDPNSTSNLAASYIGRVLINYDGTDTWFRMQSGNRMRITTTGGTDFIIPNTGEMTYNGNTVIHTGNIGSQSVSYASSAGSADQIDGRPFRNTGSNDSVNADDIASNGITYYTAGVSNFSGNATDGALYSQAYSNAWQHQIAGDYRSGQIALRGKNNGTWTGWRTVLDSSNYSNWAIARSGDTIDNIIYFRTNQGDYLGSLDSAKLQVYNDNNQSAFMSFHRGGYYAVNFGLDRDNVMRIGGWSAAANRWELDMSGNNTVAGSFRAPIFYDSADTGYYVDPNSTSRLDSIWVRGANQYAGIIYVGGTAAGNRLNINYDQIWTNDGNLHLQYSGAGNIDMNYGGGYAFSRTSLRAPIFYDYNDTTYYLDPNSTSYLYHLILSGNSYFRPNTWIQLDGNYGIYWPNHYGLHLYPNNDGSYGSLQVKGSKNSWHGIHFDSGNTLMSNANEAGFHQQGVGWKFRWYNGEMYISAGSTGGGTERTVIHSGNIGSQSVNYATSAGSSSSSSRSSALDIVGYGSGNMTYYQTSGTFAGYSGWAGYFVSNHGDGATYYNQTIIMPFWGAPQYSRLQGGTFVGPYTFWTTENLNDYAPNMNQYVRTSDNVTFNTTTAPTILVNNHSDNTKGYRIHNTSGSSVSAMFTNSSNQLVIAAGAVDQINLNKKVYVNGVALGVNVAPSATAGRIDASNDIVAYSSSDERLKYNITPIENAIDKVKSLTGVEFDWKPEYKHAHGYEGHDTGIIAQQVQEVIPSAVRTNDTGFLAVRYEKLIGLLVEGMKEQQAQIEELKAKLDGLTK